jgi:formate hydrogenlyase subunit 6/NADH:ubiquinone oxidoreductase subunit I
VTVTYPKEPMVLPDNFRGRPVYDPKTCIGCKLCERDCPSKVITISKVADKTWACTFRLGQCIYCGQCAFVCPKKSITMSHIYEMATFNRDSLTETTAGEPPPPLPPSPEGESSAPPATPASPQPLSAGNLEATG